MANERLETVQIKAEKTADNPDGVVTINKEDYDEKQHKLFDTSKLSKEDQQKLDGQVAEQAAQEADATNKAQAMERQQAAAQKAGDAQAEFLAVAGETAVQTNNEVTPEVKPWNKK